MPATLSRHVRAFIVATLGAVGSVDAAQRTFVASGGSDLNACIIEAPCRSFARAITQTDPDGEIIVADSAGYGAVTIDKSVAIIAPPGIYAGITVFSGNGVVIAGAGIDVTLRGLTINGHGGNVGIFYTFGATLHVDRCVVSHMTGHGIQANFGGDITIADSVIRENGGSGLHVILNPKVLVERTRLEKNGGHGVDFSPTAVGSELAVHDSVIAANNGHGILASDSGGGADVSLSNSILTRNNSVGVVLEGLTASPTRLFAHRNTITGNVRGVFVDGTNGSATATLTDNLVSGNSTAGINATSDGATVIIDHNTVTGNGQGLIQNLDGVIMTRSNNTVRLNGTDVLLGPLTAVGGT